MYVREWGGGRWFAGGGRCTVDTEAFVFDWENVHSTFDKLVIDYDVTAKHHLSHNHRTS